MQKNKKNAFTLIELMVVISIIAILILGSNFLSFNNISNKQKLETKAIRISAHFEEIRNNALLWKGIWKDLFVPKKYKIDFSTSWSWIIKNTYLSWTIYEDYNLFNKEVIFWNRFETLSSISCLKLNWDENILTKTETGTLLIEWSVITLKWDCNIDEKILQLEIKRKNNTKKIQINSLNWLIEIIK